MVGVLCKDGGGAGNTFPREGTRVLDLSDNNIKHGPHLRGLKLGISIGAYPTTTPSTYKVPLTQGYVAAKFGADAYQTKSGESIVIISISKREVYV